MNRDEMIEMIRKKATFHKQFDEKVHIRLYSGKFYNGKIIRIFDQYLVFFDRKEGEKKILFDEIKIITEFTPDNGKE